MRRVGIGLGLVITAGLAVLVGLDRQARLAAAERQSLALATGVDRLLQVELRNIERALRGILADIDADADLPREVAVRRRAKSLAGVTSRHEELARIDYYPPAGGEDAAPGPPTWLAKGAASSSLRIGPLLSDDSGDWQLPLAITSPEGGAVVARFRVQEFANIIDGLDTGVDGSVAIYDADGTVITRYGRTGAHVGRQVVFPEGLDARRRFSVTVVSPLDQIERTATFTATSGYPLVVSSGIGVREAMRPWWVFVICALVLSAVYWTVFAFVVRRLRADERARDAMLEEIATQGEWLQQAQLASGTGVWRIERGHSEVRASPELAALYALEACDGRIELDAFFERMHPDDADLARATFSAAQEQGGTLLHEYRVILTDGRVRWLKAQGAAVGTGAQAAMTGTVSDITNERDAQARIERAESQFRQLFERNPLPSWVYDTGSLRMLAVNEAALEAYGYSRDAFLALAVTDLVPAPARAETPDLAAHCVGRRERLWTVLAQDGRRIEVRVHARDIELQQRPARLMLAEDVGARLAYERDLAWRASHDPTTGMLTLPALSELLGAECGGDADAEFAVACVSLRDLELIAPTLGRQASEMVLREAAARISRVAAQFGHAAYAPAETFVVVALDPQQLDAMVQALTAAIDTPVQVDGATFALEAWIGVARGSCKAGTAEAVVAHAALAALRARRERARVIAYDPGLSAQAAERLALVRRLRDAVEDGGFELVYQPIHRLADARVVAVEALIRWPQGDGTTVSPADFIPLAEESGLIVPIGAWVLEEAARAWRRFAEAGRADIAVAVNVSALQFDAGITHETMRTLRATHGLPRSALHLELTESVLLRTPDAARALMMQLREEGLCLSIDDFGTGFSSMAYLRDLPIDHLKIDRAFVRDVECDPRSAAICRTMIALGHGLGLQVIAEGVETPEQLAWLRAQGCDQAQGFHLGRPEALDSLLRRVPPARATADATGV
ncbi:EAL domain-containing protein [Luteimonas sp. WGS1318]|uniref:bifunctional diguanylate cyclase/phosphodiesterase n=1 Tax=Luteimonas sp. WGS1318 TaxID=3366815 RepID=UPI00372D7C53